MAKKSKMPEIPEWAMQITALRESLIINQAELARRLACSAMTISRWERGLLQPSAEHFIQLGNLGDRTQAWFFWERAGIQPAKMAGALSAVSKSRRSGVLLQTGRRQRNADDNRKSGNVSVRLLKGFVGAHSVPGDRRSLRTIPEKGTISVPAKWCPNPDYTSVMPVRGHTLEPLIHDGDFVAVDSFQTERESLYGNLVVATNQGQGLSLAFLRRYGTVDVLEGQDRRYEPVILSKPGVWRIAGRVLWWISSAVLPTASRAT
jgi:transcriptional regulator with XRE-family HTH domain